MLVPNYTKKLHTVYMSRSGVWNSPKLSLCITRRLMICEAIVEGKAAHTGSFFFFLITAVSRFSPVRCHARGLCAYDNPADSKGQLKVAR